jgi:hypothetical protein
MASSGLSVIVERAKAGRLETVSFSVVRDYGATPIRRIADASDSQRRPRISTSPASRAVSPSESRSSSSSGAVGAQQAETLAARDLGSARRPPDVAVGLARSRGERRRIRRRA